MFPKLFAFDLDGTLLNNKKELSANNIIALKEISETGSIVALASGRIGSSMQQYVHMLDNKVALLTLNGAVVYKDAFDISAPIYNSPLPAQFADYLIQYAQNKNFGLNYYIDDKLYGLKHNGNSQWYDLYFKQTLSEYSFISNFNYFNGKSPSKIIFVGDPEELNEIEKYFRSVWGNSIYICRTWDYYLEFLNINANKGTGIEALANSYNIDISDVVAFGDAPNDIPMLQKVGLGIAMKNADPEVKSAAKKTTSFTNDDDGIACEWKLIKREFFS
jgi:Cof subfamily protein (haloacid dehalogenase superfamily)